VKRSPQLEASSSARLLGWPFPSRMPSEGAAPSEQLSPNRNFAPPWDNWGCTQVAIYEKFVKITKNSYIFWRNDSVIFAEIERKNKDVSSQDETSLSIQS
jgi:hypothetical protein